MSTRDNQLRQLEQACRELLTRHPQGLSEYQLLQYLRSEEFALLPKVKLDDHLGLFQSHFLLFHLLYHLRDHLHETHQGSLSISALSIRLSPYRAVDASLCESDPLRDYYLDLDNLHTAGERDVLELLASFWQRMQLDEPEKIEAALEVLEMEQAQAFCEVKAQYRRLVMQHHPDRGGEAAKMHALSEALEIMRCHFNA